MKKLGKIYVRVFPDHPITKKPAETRMGTGKGGVEGWVAVVKPGRVIFEVEGVHRGDRPGGVPPRAPQAAGQDPARQAGGCAVSKSRTNLEQLRDLPDDELAGS